MSTHEGRCNRGGCNFQTRKLYPLFYFYVFPPPLKGKRGKVIQNNNTKEKNQAKAADWIFLIGISLMVSALSQQVGLVLNEQLTAVSLVNIGGSASAPIVASAYNPSYAGIGVLMGSWGGYR